MKTKQYAAHPLTTTQSELPSAILSALTIALLSALLFTSCSKHHYLELLLDPDGEPIENPGRILLSAPGVANPLLPAILTDPAREDRIVATVLHDQPVDVEAGTYNLLCTLPTDGSNTEYFGTDAFTLNGTTISLPLLAPDGRLPQAPDVLTDATPVTVTSGRTIQTALTPAPRTRLVRLDVRLQGADASSITAITARLEGVSRTARLEHRYTAANTPTPVAGGADRRPARTPHPAAEVPTQTNSPAPSLRANAKAPYYLLTNLQLDASTPTDPEATGTFRLLGTDSSATGQRILITATLADGTTLSYEQDVTSLFSGFNPPATATTLRLAATLNFGIDQVSGTIIPWTPGWNEGGTGL